MVLSKLGQNVQQKPPLVARLSSKLPTNDNPGADWNPGKGMDDGRGVISPTN